MSGNNWDIIIMLAFGGMGYLMKKFDYEPVPLVLAFVLGRMVEESLRQSLVLSRGSLMIFFSHPISGTFLLGAFVLILLPFIVSRVKGALQMGY